MDKNTKEKFLSDVVNELNDYSERMTRGSLDIPFMVSVVEQAIDKFGKLIDEISDRNIHVNGYDEDATEGYTNGKLRLLVEKENPESDMMVDAFEDYCYYIEFGYDSRHWGYCECTPDMEGFNSNVNCCGHGCDWDAPNFKITKEIHICGHSWEGDESDYWRYLDKYNSDESNKNKEVEERLKNERIDRLKADIESKNAELSSLLK